MDEENVGGGCVYMCIYTHTQEYYSVLKKNKILPYVTTWMNLEDIMLSEISQSQKDTHCMIPLT